ncbi:SREBP regulating gene protein isoform X3 [Mustela nigripes]|uniref:SREBP regulating gene protein n=1 Tax=Mustela putorius furo TaxID=9669 RepID=A0A8U0MRI3_MUSPF|nr:SREBP regulating gene protein isoform X3 [Mustela putorius furo]XP_059264498.1 SREBP regulating gene protein isoform X3 [Mustela nigripes]
MAMPPGPRAFLAPRPGRRALRPRRHGEPGGHGVAPAPPEEVGARPGLRALARLLPQQHLQAGYICERKDLLVNGCCNVNVPGTKQYRCDGCLPHGCCGAYEYCVSCCLQPSKQLLLERFLNRAAVAFQNLFMAVEDHFELCLAKCRTSSQSVQHENTYRDPIAKYCYGESPPELFPA